MDASACRSSREHLYRHDWGLGALAPLAWVAERDLLEADAVVMGRARDVQVSIDGDFGSEPSVPIGGPGGAAPLCELGVPQPVRQLADQWPVADEHGLHVGAEGGQPAFGFLHPVGTPGLPIRVGV